MNPSSNETSGNGIKLPPIPEQQPLSGGVPEVAAADSQFEAPVAGAGEKNLSAIQAAAPALPSIPLPPLGSTPQDLQAAATPPTGTAIPGIADDADLIEKEWVSKAKQIIEKTRNDPYEQSKEITIFKADYMKKRYNKTIKQSE